MVFSKEKWNTEGIRQFVSASNALSFETLAGPMQQTWQSFIVPLIGDALAVRITGMFLKDVADRTAEERVVLSHAQSAVANLTLWFNFTELNTRLTDQGHQRQESENFKSVYKYQENELKQSYKNKGFNSIDALLSSLDQYADKFEQWLEAPAYTARKGAIVKSTREVNDVVFINMSYVIFLRLLPILRRIEQTQLPTMLGLRLFDEFKSKLKSEDKEIGNTQVEMLRSYIVRVMVNKAVAELIRETGSLTDRGLYYETTLAGKDGDEMLSPQNMKEASRKAEVYERAAAEHYMQLNNFVEYYIPELFVGRPEDAYKRDNDNKRTFWA